MWRYHQKSHVIHIFTLTILYDWIQSRASRNNNLKTQKEFNILLYFTSPLPLTTPASTNTQTNVYAKNVYTNKYKQLFVSPLLLLDNFSLCTNSSPLPPLTLSPCKWVQPGIGEALSSHQWSSFKSRNHSLSNLGGQLPSNISDLSENARTSCRRSAQFTLSCESRIMISDPKIARLSIWT